MTAHGSAQPFDSSGDEPGGESRTLRARVHGQVQGVGFRFFVLRHARRLGLGGSVRNLPNGDVEVLACGSQADLTALLQALDDGPDFSKVEHVDAEWGVPLAHTSDFTIEF